METVKLKVKLRDKMGTGYSRKLRREGGLPAILYGPHLKISLPLEIEQKDLREFISRLSKGETVITLDIINEKKKKEREVIVKDVQRDWLRGGLQHIDFYEITRGEEVSTAVPLSFIGKTEGEKLGGVVEHLLREVKIECLPRNIPLNIEVEISSLNIGDSLDIEDLAIPSGVKVVNNPEERVVTVLHPTRIEEEVEEEEEEEVEEEVEVIGKKEREGEGGEASEEVQEKPPEKSKE